LFEVFSPLTPPVFRRLIGFEQRVSNKPATRKNKCQKQLRGIQKTNRMDMVSITTTPNVAPEVRFHLTTGFLAQAGSRSVMIVKNGMKREGTYPDD